MCHHDGRRSPAKRAVTVAIEVNDIGLENLLQAEEPVASRIDVSPGRFHPLQAKIALVEDHPGFAQGTALIVTRPRPHRREVNLDAALTEK